jgi:hypothetical protein
MQEEYNERLWNYANGPLFLLAKEDEAKCDRVIKGLHKFSEEEKLTLKNYWKLIVHGTVDLYLYKKPVEEEEEKAETEVVVEEPKETYYDEYWSASEEELKPTKKQKSSKQ